MCLAEQDLGGGGREGQMYTPADVATHNHKGDCWIVVDSVVYDVTPWLSRHPGGQEILLMYAGDDATDVFKAFHHPREFKRLKAYEVGKMLPESEQPVHSGLKAYRALNDELWKAGWFEPTLRSHVRIVAIAWALLAACVGLLAVARTEAAAELAGGWGQLCLTVAAGVCLSQFWQQNMLVAHDACHTGITRDRKTDSWIGALCGTLCAGIGASWWTKDHNEHHAVTNQVEGEKGGDRTAGAVPFLTVSELQLAPVQLGDKEGLPLWYWVLLMAQYWIYWPIMLVVARFNLHILSVVLAVKDERLVRDVGLMAAFFAHTYALTQLAPAHLRWTFYWTAHVGISMLHVVIGLNHFHMPMYNDVIKPADGGWIKHQLHTTCNITNGLFMNWWAGGLQQQVEHHLFPQLPRSRLPKVKPMVMELCAKHGLEYREHGFWALNKMVWDGLWDVTSSPLARLSLWEMTKLN